MPEFTSHQNDAIHFRGQDACVVAGPGSGKTTVLVERYYRLVEDHRFDPAEILAITFTEKAAANMKARLAEKFQHDRLRLRELESAWVSTIHGFCARLLRENAIAAGIDPRFKVHDARESDDLQYECLNAALDELVAQRREDALALIEALQNPLYLASDLKSVYDAIRSSGKSIEEVRAMPSPIPKLSPITFAKRLMEALYAWPEKRTPLQSSHREELFGLANTLSRNFDGLEDLRQAIKSQKINLSRVPVPVRPPLEAIRDDFELLIAKALDQETAHFRQIVFDILVRFEELYRERKIAAGALDFNDLEKRAIELLKRVDSRRMFRQIMLDEYQDINDQQSELIQLIRGQDVFFAVGDVNQSIYGFRHARPDIFHKYRQEIEESGKHSAGLLHNFRSRAEILRCVEALLNGSDGIEPRELIAGATFDEKDAPSIEVLRAYDEDKDEASAREARWIAHLILEKGYEFRDYAVLCRNGESMQPILAEFDKAGIPYVCGRRQSFLLSREGQDITALLHLIANPRDGIARTTVLRSPLVGVSDEMLLQIRLGQTELPQPFRDNLKRWRADISIAPLDVLIARMLSDCGFEWSPGSVSGDNVEAFLHLARTRGANRTLLEFLHELESIESAINAESDLSDADQGNCVQVMTAHAAKGLEFPVTIIAGMEKGTRQSSAAVSFTPEYGIGIKWKDGSDDEGLKDSWAFKNAEHLKQREKEESNRLLYVAMTRAEDHLILSYSCGRQKPSNWARKVDDFFVNGATVGVDATVLLKDADPPQLTAQERDRSREPGVAVIARPDVRDQYDTAVNVTSLAAFAQCPRRYYLGRYVGWSGNGRSKGAKKFDPEELPAAELGSRVHEVLTGKPGPHPEEALELAAVFQNSELGRRAASADRSEREWDFIADIDGTLIRGSVDLWFEEPDGIHIVDYKTDSEIHTSEHAPQLALYAVALERAFGTRPARASLHYLRKNTVEDVPLHDAAVDNARDLIAAIREAQETLTFDLNEGEHCHSCPYFRSLCPAGNVR